MQKIIRLNLLHKIKYVLISILLISCKETKGQEHKDTADRFEWSPLSEVGRLRSFL